MLQGLASLEDDSLPYPFGEGLFVNLACSNRKHRPFGIVDLGRIGLPSAAVEVDEHDKRGPSGALVAVGQWVIAS